MNANAPPVKTITHAPLKNVVGCLSTVNRLINRAPGLPGLGVMYSPSGYGKSWASIYAQNKTGAVRVEVGESWNRKTLLGAILLECGDPLPKGTAATLMAEVIRSLGDNPMRPLFIDEADKLVDKGMIELVREIHEHSQCPVLLIGEELLPKKLQAVERVHNRVLEWCMAQPCDLSDAQHLAKVYLPGVSIGDDLLEKARAVAQGRARRIVVTLSNMAEWARGSGAKTIPADWNGTLCNGEPPVRGRR